MAAEGTLCPEAFPPKPSLCQEDISEYFVKSHRQVKIRAPKTEISFVRDSKAKT